jgi:hypothetical protein
MSKEVEDRFVDALRKLEEEQDVEALVEIHTENCEVGNVAVPQTFEGHDGLREFWTQYRKTFGEMRSEFRNVFADEEGILEIEGDKVRRFMAYFDTRRLTHQIVD